MANPQLKIVPRAAAMPVGLVETKLHPPRPRPNAVRRERLLDAIRRAGLCRLLLVSAPAGFGKSTLVASWAAECGAPVTWLSLDEDDAAPERFVRYLVASIRTVLPDIGDETLAALELPELPAPDSLLGSLVNELAGRDRLTVVLDDYHLVSGSAVDDIVRFLVESLPANVSVAISTRTDPGFPLSRLRVRGELVELRSADLRFTPSEAAAFLNETMQLELSGDEIGLVEDRTEGWAAGLQLAALSLRGRSDRRSFLESFSGSNRFVIDYLVDEVLAHLDDALRAFVLRVSILPRFCAPLCDAVTSSSGSTGLLERLETENLFLIALDDTRTWYRFHHLFADLVRRELEASIPKDELAALHERAARWLIAESLPGEAIEHACQAGARELAVGVLETYGRAEMAAGNLGRVARWFERVPSSWLDRDPVLLFDYATVLYGNLRIREFLPILQRFEALAAASDDPAVAEYLETLHVLRDTAAHPPSVTLERGRALYERSSDSRIRAMAGIVLGLAAIEGTSLEESNRWLEDAKRTSLADGNLLLALVASSFIGWSLYVVGEIDAAEKEWDEALALAGGSANVRNPAASIALAGRSGVALDRNRLDDARAFALEAIDAGRAGIGTGRVHALIHLVWIELGSGNPDGARARARELDEFLRNAGGDRGCAYAAVLALRVELEIARQAGAPPRDVDDLLERLVSIDDSAPTFDIPGETRQILPTTLAIALALAGRRRDSRKLLDDAIDFAREAGLARDLCEALLLRAGLALGERREDAARRDVNELLQLASSRGFVFLFSRHRAETAALLRLVDLDELVGRGFAETLRSACAIGTRAGSDNLLSEREREILAAVAGGLTNAKVAEKLFIAPQTVKKHLENIYAKLGVGSRTEAVAVARREGLLLEGEMTNGE